MLLHIPPDAKTYELRNSIIWFDNEGILYSIPKPEAPEEFSDENIQEELDKFRGIIGDKKVCMIAETRPGQQAQLKREQRSTFARELSAITKAMAVITTSPLSRMIANIFFSFTPPDYPLKMFNSEEEARKWIRKYL
jgi:hypothetical protein